MGHKGTMPREKYGVLSHEMLLLGPKNEPQSEDDNFKNQNH